MVSKQVFVSILVNKLCKVLSQHKTTPMILFTYLKAPLNKQDASHDIIFVELLVRFLSCLANKICHNLFSITSFWCSGKCKLKSHVFFFTICLDLRHPGGKNHNNPSVFSLVFGHFSADVLRLLI